MSGRNRSRLWGGITMAALAAVAAVISYLDGLFLVRTAGNTGWVVYLYPLLPDGLIVICLIALYDAASAGAPRPRWATAGLALGIALTLAMNTAAGAAHSVLDMVVDGAVPVVFFVAVEVLIGLIRRGRPRDTAGPGPATVPGSVPSDVFAAAKASMAATAAAGNPLTRNQLQSRFPLTRAQADEIWQPYNPKRDRGGDVRDHSAAPVTQAAPARDVAPGVPAGASNGQVRHG